MSELKVQDFHGKQVIDSRDVAKWIGQEHKNLLSTIRGYKLVITSMSMDENSRLKIQPSDFFVESSYENRGKEYPCYLLTKKGCDMVANKLTGEKGIAFTAAYVTAFEEMRQALTAPRTPVLPEGVTFSSAVGFMRLARRVILDMGGTPAQVGMMMKETLETCGFPVPTSFRKQLEGQMSLFDPPSLEQ